MLILHVIVAGAAVAVVALRPRSATVAGALAAAGAAAVVLGSPARPLEAVVLPLPAFFTAALTLAAYAERSALADRAAAILARRAHGSAVRLYVDVCLLCAALTSIVSLDGAVVLLVPILRTLARSHRAPFAPLFLGV